MLCRLLNLKSCYKKCTFVEDLKYDPGGVNFEKALTKDERQKTKDVRRKRKAKTNNNLNKNKNKTIDSIVMELDYNIAIR